MSSFILSLSLRKMTCHNFIGWPDRGYSSCLLSISKNLKQNILIYRVVLTVDCLKQKNNRVVKMVEFQSYWYKRIDGATIPKEKFWKFHGNWGKHSDFIFRGNSKFTIFHNIWLYEKIRKMCNLCFSFLFFTFVNPMFFWFPEGLFFVV